MEAGPLAELAVPGFEVRAVSVSPTMVSILARISSIFSKSESSNAAIIFLQG